MTTPTMPRLLMPEEVDRTRLTREEFNSLPLWQKQVRWSVQRILLETIGHYGMGDRDISREDCESAKVALAIFKNDGPYEFKRCRISESDRKAVFERDGHKCHYCGGTEKLSIDHKIPVCRAGTNDLENLVSACWGCNRAKGIQNYRNFISRFQQLTEAASYDI